MKETKKSKEKKILKGNTKEETLKAMPPNNISPEEEIRRKANEIYNLRKESDIERTPEDDWYQAEKHLRNYSIPVVQ